MPTSVQVCSRVVHLTVSVVFSVFVVIIHPSVFSINTSEDRVVGTSSGRDCTLLDKEVGKLELKLDFQIPSLVLLPQTELHSGGGGDGRTWEKVKTATCGGE